MTCGNYNSDFICNLLKQVDDKIALITNKDYKNSIYNLGSVTKATDYADLLDISDILNRVLKCNSCYCDVDVEDLVSMVKNKLNRC